MSVSMRTYEATPPASSTRASSVVSMMFWGFSWTVKSCCWNLWNSLNWTKRTTVTLLLQENDQLCIKSFFQPLLTPTGSAFYFYRCCSSFVHMLLMWSAIESVDFHPSTSRTQNGRSLFSAVLHVSESRSPGFFLRSRVNRCGGQCVLKLLANSSSSAGWMKLELLRTKGSTWKSCKKTLLYTGVRVTSKSPAFKMSRSIISQIKSISTY